MSLNITEHCSTRLSPKLRLEGYTDSFAVEWDDINMQDAVQLSNARLNNARAEQIEFETGKVKNDRRD